MADSMSRSLCMTLPGLLTFIVELVHRIVFQGCLMETAGLHAHARALPCATAFYTLPAARAFPRKVSTPCCDMDLTLKQRWRQTAKQLIAKDVDKILW